MNKTYTQKRTVNTSTRYPSANGASISSLQNREPDNVIKIFSLAVDDTRKRWNKFFLQFRNYTREISSLSDKRVILTFHDE